MRRPVPPWVVQLGLALGALILCTAPTPGDVGGCGQDAQELDPELFFSNKDFIDCERCTECGFESSACDRACSDQLSQSTFPAECMPLVHDGEVCLRALLDTDCDEYASYVSDSPEVPHECNFCPVR
ncbi:MAG TPA: hypothetical protein VM686_39430 [Polyangiaceae bacterium]|nr:hypothetical protein [Polyangiaceae bacterium]